MKSSWIENGGFRSRDFWGVSNKPTSSLDELYVIKIKTGEKSIQRKLTHPLWIRSLQAAANSHRRRSAPGCCTNSSYTWEIKIVWGASLSRDLSTGSANAAKACVRRRRTTFLLILAQLLQPWWRRLPEACVEVGEDEEEDGHEGEEDHASWGWVRGWRVTNLRRWTAACKTLTSPAWERESDRWCSTGNVTDSIVCSFLELLQLGLAAWLDVLFWATLSMRRMHNVSFAEFYMWDFPIATSHRACIMEG